MIKPGCVTKIDAHLVEDHVEDDFVCCDATSRPHYATQTTNYANELVTSKRRDASNSIYNINVRLPFLVSP